MLPDRSISGFLMAMSTIDHARVSSSTMSAALRRWCTWRMEVELAPSLNFYATMR